VGGTCISGERGSGTVFFSAARELRLLPEPRHQYGRYWKSNLRHAPREIYCEVIEQGAHNINLVNPTHFTDAVIESLGGGLPSPSSGTPAATTALKLYGCLTEKFKSISPT
jgi:putative pyruvate formate lyase activating enzyme